MDSIISNLILAQQAAPSDDIYDIVVLEPKESPWGMIFWLVVALILLLAIAAGIWFWLRQRSARKESQSPEAKVAEDLRQLAALQGEMEPNAFSLAISEALKDYLSERFKDPVRYETIEEFLARASSSKSPLPSPAADSLRQFLVKAEEVKFGNLPDAGERAEPLLALAGSVVTQCRPALSQSNSPKGKSSPPRPSS